VDCGSVPTQDHASQIGDAKGQRMTSMVFGEQAVFKCGAGYSTDGQLGSELLTYSVSCQVSGELFYPAACLTTTTVCPS
jgi:hypothetical protein